MARVAPAADSEAAPVAAPMTYSVAAPMSSAVAAQSASEMPRARVAPVVRVAQAPRHPPRPAANLESAGQSARMRLGIAALAVALGAVLALEAFEAPRAWRLVLFLPFFLTLFGATQALYRTCPSLAARGVREVCGSEEPVARASERQRSQQLGRRVLWLSLLGAALATAGFSLLP